MTSASRFVNLTPHAIVLMDGTGEVLERVEPSGQVARVGSRPGRQIAEYAGCPVHAAPVVGGVEGLGEPVGGVLYIVSAMVASAVVGRPDVVSPGTGPADGAVRDAGGRILGVTRLIQSPLADADVR